MVNHIKIRNKFSRLQKRESFYLELQQIYVRYSLVCENLPGLGPFPPPGPTVDQQKKQVKKTINTKYDNIEKADL